MALFFLIQINSWIQLTMIDILFFHIPLPSYLSPSLESAYAALDQAYTFEALHFHSIHLSCKNFILFISTKHPIHFLHFLQFFKMPPRTSCSQSRSCDGSSSSQSSGPSNLVDLSPIDEAFTLKRWEHMGMRSVYSSVPQIILIMLFMILFKIKMLFIWRITKHNIFFMLHYFLTKFSYKPVCI